MERRHRLEKLARSLEFEISRQWLWFEGLSAAVP